jgi:cytoskeletal protein RodZ
MHLVNLATPFCSTQQPQTSSRNCRSITPTCCLRHKMKPTASFTVLLALWLFREAQARRINKTRTSQDAHSSDQACTTKDAEPNLEPCITESIEHTTTADLTTDPSSVSQTQIEVTATGDIPVCMKASSFPNLPTDDVQADMSLGRPRRKKEECPRDYTAPCWCM